MNINIFEMPDLPLPLTKELVTILIENKNIRIERIISAGQVSDWYDQTQTEFVVLLDGNAVIEFENGRNAAMSKGDALLIDPHERHRVSFTSVHPLCVWLCIFW